MPGLNCDYSGCMFRRVNRTFETVEPRSSERVVAQGRSDNRDSNFLRILFLSVLNNKR